MYKRQAVLIPAYNPDKKLVSLVRDLFSYGFSIVIVNDGSSKTGDVFFEEVGKLATVTVLTHAINLGKGAALKTGINWIVTQQKTIETIITADADGQHSCEAIVLIAKEALLYPKGFIIGARSFNKKKVPLRSKYGNKITRYIYKLISGRGLTDTQSGLRAFPALFSMDLLSIAANGYEFELDVLFMAEHAKVQIFEKEIETIYIDENSGSHFNPIRDSIKIYFTLFRFALVGVLTSLIDFFVFYLCLKKQSTILFAQMMARTVAMVFNYTLAKRSVFHSYAKHSTVFPKYLLLVFTSGFISYAFIGFLIQKMQFPVLAAKIMAEGILFICNFLIQRDLIFFQRNVPTRTDWDEYYANPYKITGLTRKITQRHLLAILGEYIGKNKNPAIVELGGANSCFLEVIRSAYTPSCYKVIDNNESGLKKLALRTEKLATVILKNQNILGLPSEPMANIVFSVGLIEHFNQIETAEAIASHFKLVCSGGLVLMTFPHPTWLYRITRSMLELLGIWIFHDERPLFFEEVLASLPPGTKILHKKIIWPIFLTQGVIAAIKP